MKIALESDQYYRFYADGGSYRYSFNGKEKENEIASGDLDFGARIYDARLGRWLSVDPIIHPSVSPYGAYDNNPILKMDSDGEDAIVTVDKVNKTIVVTSTVYYWSPTGSTYSDQRERNDNGVTQIMQGAQSAAMPWNPDFNIDVNPADGVDETYSVQFETVFVPITDNTQQGYEAKAQRQVSANPGSNYLVIIDEKPGTPLDKNGDKTATTGLPAYQNAPNGAYLASVGRITVNLQTTTNVTQTFGHELGHSMGLADACADPNSPVLQGTCELPPGQKNGATDATGPAMSYAQDRTASIYEVRSVVTNAVNMANTQSGQVVTVEQKGGSGPGGVQNTNVALIKTEDAPAPTEPAPTGE